MTEGSASPHRERAHSANPVSGFPLVSAFPNCRESPGPVLSWLSTGTGHPAGLDSDPVVVRQEGGIRGRDCLSWKVSKHSECLPGD